MLILLYFIIPFLLHIAYISVNSWSSSHVSCIVCLVSLVSQTTTYLAHRLVFERAQSQQLLIDDVHDRCSRPRSYHHQQCHVTHNQYFS